MSERISAAAARRIAIAAQGLARPRPQPWATTTRDLQRVVRDVRIVQIDSVNVLTRSHYLPFFSRLGPYDTALLDRMRDVAPRRLVEYWAHEASLIPPELWPLFRFRMDKAHSESWGWMQRAAREHPHLVESVRAEVAAAGPITARGLEAVLAHDHDRPREDWGWNWSLVKRVVEHLFWAGEIASAGRTAQFERRYALPERIFPPHLRGLVEERIEPWQAFERLIDLAGRAHGIGTELCLRDYARLRPAQARPALESLVDQGVLRPVSVDGWARTAYLHREARRPRSVHTRALLSPFDSLVWQRERVQALFDFTYRIEIYTPAEKRVHGYYVLPFLLGDELVGRVDLKSDRADGVLRIQRVTWEDGRGGAADRAELDAELDLMADWLRLSEVRNASPIESRTAESGA
ncbi:winged helix-turn-helix domain-containing protein [Nostocoides sp. F2B08]|uniref:winged helix-turn-helix domain-containing protein n=1 Tax=Nostocoides sp. F2B08 TaxID=2653936 RepID=UPI001D04F9EA|nr:crosslink repair DNA glycosylase YcaQ family protein [Tetrasphaera sp. F2B08]